jgi:hypothetical protein
VDSEISKDATIESNLSSLETIDERAIGHAVCTRLRVNTRNPERAELTLALAAVTISVLSRFGDGLLGHTEHT